MTALRNKYIRDLAIRGKAKRTQESYTSFVKDLAQYHRRSPDLLSYDEVADWLFHLVRERKLSSSSVNIAVNAARFLYGVTLGRDLHELFAKVPRIKREIHGVPTRYRVRCLAGTIQLNCRRHRRRPSGAASQQL